MRWRDVHRGAVVYHGIFTHWGKGIVCGTVAVDPGERLFENGNRRVLVDFEGRVQNPARMRLRELHKRPNRQKILRMIEIYKGRGVEALDGGDRLVLPQKGKVTFQRSLYKGQSTMSNTTSSELQEVLSFAEGEAQYFNHEYIGTEHLLLALLADPDLIAHGQLRGVGLDLRTMRTETEKLILRGPDNPLPGKLPLTPQVLGVLKQACSEADRLCQAAVTSKHILLALLDNEEGVAVQVLLNCNVNLQHLRKAIVSGMA